MRSPTRSFPKARLSAFTLLEILVVLAIIGMLVGLAVTKVGGILDSSSVKTTTLFVTTSIKTPLTAYRLDMGDYPSTAEGLQALLIAPQGKEANWHGPYLDVTGGKLPQDAWKQDFVYKYPGTHNLTGYDLYSVGPDHTDGTADDIGNW